MSKLSRYKKQNRVGAKTARAWLAKLRRRKESQRNEKISQTEEHIKERTCSQIEEDFAKHCVSFATG